MALLFRSRLMWLLLFISWVHFLAAQPYRITLSPQKAGDKVLENSFGASRYVFSFEGLHVLDVKTDKGTFSQLILPKGHYVGKTGTPMLPALNSLIEIPYGAEVSLHVKSYNSREYRLEEYEIHHPLMPVQPSLKKNANPADLPFEYDPSYYSKSGYIEHDIANIEVLGSLRGVRIARLSIAPVAYNPAEGTIRVYNDIEVELQYSGSDPAAMSYQKASVYSPYFDAIYGQLLSSFADHQAAKSLFNLPRIPVRMLVISTPDFQETLQPFIRWQTEKGFEVIERYTNVIGSSSSAIKSFISGEYHSATPEKPAPTFLVIAGDIDRIPASSIGSATGEVTDLYYAAVDGGFFPDMYYGRLSARNQQELKNQIDKIIYYQKYQFEDPTYLNDVTLIAGSDNFWNQLILQPTVKYGAENYFNAVNGFANTNLFLSHYDGVYDNDKVAVGMLTYTAHCTSTTWSGPRLNIVDIHAFSNTGKYPLVIGNCCQSAQFSLPESIGEAWVRAENKGAVAYIGSAPDTHWFEDFYWSVGAFPIMGNNAGYVPNTSETSMGVYDAIFHYDYLPVGALQFIGNLAITEAHIRGFQSHSNTLWYWQGYHTLGDPSTMIFLTSAEENEIEHIPVIPVGRETFAVKALPGSYAAISKDGVLLGAGFVDASGVIKFTVKEVLNEALLKLVVSKPQYKTYIKDIPALQLDGPYVVYESHVINDTQGNNNQKADYGETISLHIGMQNIGSSPVEEASALLFSDDPYATIINAGTPVVFGGMQTEAGKNLSGVQDAFQVKIHQNIPNKHRVKFTLQVTDGIEQWLSEFTITVYAPVFRIEPDFVINDAYLGNNNNRLDPGESVIMSFRVNNAGGAKAMRPIVSLSPSSAYFTYDQQHVVLDQLNPGDMRMAAFTVHANASALDGTVVPFEISVLDGHSLQMESSITIGQAPQIVIGAGKAASNQFPFYNLYKANRTQILYLAQELGAGEKTINSIGFEIIEMASRQTILQNFTIRVKHSDISQFSNAFQLMHDAVTVFQSSAYQMPTTLGWHYWQTLDFVYDGRRNLVVEISWGQNPGWTTPFYRVASTQLDRNRVAYGFSDNHVVPPFSGVSPNRPNMLLGFITPPPKPMYLANFLIKNGMGQPIEMAGVKIGTKKIFANPSGIVTFSLYPGNYSYEVSAPEALSSIVSNFTIENGSKSFTAQFFDVSFNLKNSKSNEVIQDATVSINNNSFSPGKYLIRNLPPGQYPFAVSRDGYLDLAGVFNLSSQNLAMDLMMVPDTIVSAHTPAKRTEGSLKVYPNPAQDQVAIVLPFIEQEAYIELINYQGRVVTSMWHSSAIPGQETRLNIRGIVPGIYFLRVRQGDLLMTEKVIIY